MEMVWQIAIDFWGVLTEMAPYLLFGFLVAGVLSVFISAARVERHLGGGGLVNVLKASLFGVPLPLCSCGVIPVAASLKAHGASRAASVSFLISTPQTGADSIFVTYSLLGGVFAIFRPVAALISGTIGGLITAGLTPDPEDETTEAAQAEGADACTDSCRDEGEAAKEHAPSRSRVRRALAYGFGTLPRDIAPALLIGLVLAALITALLPTQRVAGWLGGGIVGILVMMVLGIPVYVCATASVPIMAALILKGAISPGAGFAFLMTGPATNAATVATVWKMMGRRSAIVYVATMAGTAVLGGLALDSLFEFRGAVPAPPEMWMLPQWFKTFAGAALLGLLGWSIASKWLHRAADTPEPEESPGAGRTLVLQVDEMTCSHCASTVQRALEGLAGARDASVSLEDARATVRGDVDPVAARQRIEKLGYHVESDRDA